MTGIAFAEGGGAMAQGAPGGLLFPMIIVFIIFYFLLIRPQQKKQKEHQEMINNLQKGDRVMTSGGIYGRVIEVVDPTTLSVEIADKIRVQINRGYVAGLVNPVGSKKENEKEKKGK